MINTTFIELSTAAYLDVLFVSLSYSNAEPLAHAQELQFP
jgi:hypothetical protein